MLDGASTSDEPGAAGERGCRGGGPRRFEGSAEEREARRSRGGDDEDSGAQPAEEGTREGRVVFESYRWEME
jgi:hypothetical protein